MRLTIISLMLALSMLSISIKPSDAAQKIINDDFTFGREMTLAEICEESDALVLCQVNSIKYNNVIGYDEPPSSQRTLKSVAELTRTAYVMTVHASFKGDYGNGKQFLMHLPGGEFGRYKVDFGFPELEVDSDSWYLLPMIERWGDYVPMLDAIAKLSDFWDMDGNGMINFDADKLAVIEPLGVSDCYAEYESSVELFDAIVEAVGVSEVSFELSDEYSLGASNYTLGELVLESDALVWGRIESAVGCFDKVNVVDPEIGKIRTEILPHTKYTLTVYDDAKSSLKPFSRIEFTLPVGVFNGLRSDCGLPELESGREYVLPLRLVRDKHQPIFDCIARVDNARDYNGDGMLMLEYDTGELIPLIDNGIYDNAELSMIAEYAN